jgi:hypothetical protein
MQVKAAQNSLLIKAVKRDRSMQGAVSASITGILNHFFLSHNYNAIEEVRSAITVSYNQERVLSWNLLPKQIRNHTHSRS